MEIIIVLLLMIVPISASSGENSLTLSGAIELAIAKSDMLKAGAQEKQAAVADAKATRSERFPTLTANLNAYYMNGIPQADLPFGLSLSLGQEENYQFDIRATLPLYTGGRIKHAVSLSDNIVEIKEHEYRLQELTSAYDCRTAYLNVLLTEALIQSVKASFRRVSVIRKDIENLYQNGIADSLDLLESELAVTKIETALDEQNTINLNALSLLSKIIGIETKELNLSEPIGLPSSPNSDIVLPVQSERPELSISRYRINAADEMIALKKSDYMPTLGSYVGYSGGRPNRDLINNEYNDQIMVGATLGWSLNLGNKTGRAVQSAKHHKISAELAYSELTENIRLQTEIALENLKLAYQRWINSNREYEIAKQKYRFAENKHHKGKMSVNRLLELEEELAGIEQINKISLINYYIKENDWLYITASDKIYGGL